MQALDVRDHRSGLGSEVDELDISEAQTQAERVTFTGSCSSRSSQLDDISAYCCGRSGDEYGMIRCAARRARTLLDRLSVPQFLEAAGVAALANGLCRMAAMVMDHP